MHEAAAQDESVIGPEPYERRYKEQLWHTVRARLKLSQAQKDLKVSVPMLRRWTGS